MAITARSKVPVRGREAERTDPYVPNGGMRLPPWVFDGEVLADRLRRLKFERLLPHEGDLFPHEGDLFRQVRIAGNRATHAPGGDHAEALTTLKLARQLGVWLRRTFCRQWLPPESAHSAS